jgi:hypothetical protein
MYFRGLQLPTFWGFGENSGLRANNHENLGYIRKFRGRSVFFVVGNPEKLVTVLTVDEYFNELTLLLGRGWYFRRNLLELDFLLCQARE